MIAVTAHKLPDWCGKELKVSTLPQNSFDPKLNDCQWDVPEKWPSKKATSWIRHTTAGGWVWILGVLWVSEWGLRGLDLLWIVWLNWDLRNLEAGLTSWALHHCSCSTPPEGVEVFNGVEGALSCWGGDHCHQGVLLMGGYFIWNNFHGLKNIHIQRPRFSNRSLHSSTASGFDGLADWCTYWSLSRSQYCLKKLLCSVYQVLSASWSQITTKEPQQTSGYGNHRSDNVLNQGLMIRIYPERLRCSHCSGVVAVYFQNLW